MGKLCFLVTAIYLIFMAFFDQKTRKIPIWPVALCMAVIALLHILAGHGWSAWLPGVFVGIFLYVVNRVSRGRVGTGDALVYSVTGVALGFLRNVELLMASLFLASIAALILVVIRRVGKNYAMPFIPYTAAAFFVLVCL